MRNGQQMPLLKIENSVKHIKDAQSEKHTVELHDHGQTVNQSWWPEGHNDSFVNVIATKQYNESSNLQGKI